MASETWQAWIFSFPWRSAMVRDTFRMGSYARADRPSFVMAFSICFLALGIELAKTAQRPGRHLRVAVKTEGRQPSELFLPRRQNPPANRRRILSGLFLGQLFVSHRGYLNVQVDPVQQRP